MLSRIVLVLTDAHTFYHYQFILVALLCDRRCSGIFFYNIFACGLYDGGRKM